MKTLHAHSINQIGGEQELKRLKTTSPSPSSSSSSPTSSVATDIADTRLSEDRMTKLLTTVTDAIEQFKVAARAICEHGGY